MIVRPRRAGDVVYINDLGTFFVISRVNNTFLLSNGWTLSFQNIVKSGCMLIETDATLIIEKLSNVSVAHCVR